MRRCCAVAAVVLLAACSGGGDGDAAPTTPAPGPSTTAAESTTSSAAESTTTNTTTSEPAPTGYQATVEALAADAMEGRDNQTQGSVVAQDYLLAALDEFAVPLGEGFGQGFAQGTNIIGMIPGSELPDEYLILGAHYDHLGSDCRTSVPGDDICNGAGDNAAGVAAVLEIGRRIASGPAPRRSVVLAFWDAEEDGLLGSRAYVAAPIVPLDATIAYLNWDIQGVNLLPSLADVTVVVGAETGGPALVAAAVDAPTASELDAVHLSLLFGQGRSDHAVFVEAGVPAVFFTDATSGCYHTSQDDAAAIDFDKLGQQIAIGEALALELASTDTLPAFVGNAPVATYEDARSMQHLMQTSEADIDRYTAEDQAVANQFLADLDAIVAAGPDAFGDDAVGTLLGGSAAVVELLAAGECDGFLE